MTECPCWLLLRREYCIWLARFNPMSVWSRLRHEPGSAWSRPLWRFSAARSMCCGTLRTISRSVTSSDITMSALGAGAGLAITPLITGSIPPVDTKEADWLADSLLWCLWKHQLQLLPSLMFVCSVLTKSRKESKPNLAVHPHYWFDSSS